MFEGNSKGFKNWPICAKHASFAIGLSREQVARTLKTKILKNFLSVFRDWKFYPWGSLEISRKNLWVPLATGTSTCEQVTDLSRKKHKNPNFEKYSKYFSRLGHWLASEPWKISMWARNWGMRLDQRATESPNRAALFLKFNNFCKNKILSKNN